MKCPILVVKHLPVAATMLEVKTCSKTPGWELASIVEGDEPCWARKIEMNYGKALIFCMICLNLKTCNNTWTIPH